ncbi:MAG: AAA family ATPase [Nitrospinae bacterium]|nr:AAA family ATPase [Nitrospinota bacterium]
MDTGKLLGIEYVHDTAKNGQWQLHSHLNICNLTQTSDGKYRALSNEELYKHKITAGQVYRSELAAELTRMGYSIEQGKGGLFELKGVSKELMADMSRRTSEMDAAIEKLREKYPSAPEGKLKDMAALATRDAKNEPTREEAQKWNLSVVAGHGLTPEKIRDGALEAGRDRAGERPSPAQAVKYAMEGITENEAAFKRQQLERDALKLSMGTATRADIAREVDAALADGRLIGDKRAMTTPEMVRVERSILDKAEQGRGAAPAIISGEDVDSALGRAEKVIGKTLTQDQRAAAIHALSNKDFVAGIQGDAGTGKTTLLNAVRQAAQEQGYTVRGMSFTGKAADELHTGAGMESQTLHKFLGADAPRPGGKELWVCDEASMTGARQMNELLTRAQQTEAKVLLVGDTKQLSAISAGKPFQMLQERGAMETARLETITRQKDAGYREAMKDMAAGRTDSALDKLEAQGRINEIADRKERINTIVNDFTARGEKARDHDLVVTATNRDRRDINSAVREEFKAQGIVKGGGKVFAVRETENIPETDKRFAYSYSPGQIVYSPKAGPLGRAGTEGRITEVDRDANTIKVETRGRDGGRNEWEVNLTEHGHKLNVYRETTAEISQGDRLIFLNTNSGIEVRNGQHAIVKEVNGDTITVQSSKREFTINTQDYNYLGHGYAATTHKSQGMTTERVLYNADTTREANFNAAYVGLTRGKHDARVYTNDKEEFREQIKERQQKTSALDVAESKDRAVERDRADSRPRGQEEHSREQTGREDGRRDQEHSGKDREDDPESRSGRETAKEKEGDNGRAREAREETHEPEERGGGREDSRDSREERDR